MHTYYSFIFIYIHIHIYKTLKRALVVQASLTFFPHPHPRKKKKIKHNGKRYTFKIQNELAMAYSPSVQYGYYNRLTFSLISCLSVCMFCYALGPLGGKNFFFFHCYGKKTHPLCFRKFHVKSVL